MMKLWEYAELKITRDPGVDLTLLRGWLALPGDAQYRDLGELEGSLAVVNRLGSEGWELVGNPHDVNSVYTYQSGNGTWHDMASWTDRTYYFKREVSS